MAHPLVLALFQDRPTAAEAASRLRAAGLQRGDLSVVAATHQLEGALAQELEATPGAEIEDSRPAARLGEIGGHVLAAIAVVLPGIGPIVSAGPLAADLGEAAGHVAGRIASILEDAGLSPIQAQQWESAVASGALLLGAHVRHGDAGAIRALLLQAGASDAAEASWQ
ncbi:MAG TPA: hypothetical protein VI297_01690 [Gemmatimonadales bacterium]